MVPFGGVTFSCSDFWRSDLIVCMYGAQIVFTKLHNPQKPIHRGLDIYLIKEGQSKILPVINLFTYLVSRLFSSKLF